MQIAIGIILIIAAVFLVVAVLMQSGKSHNLSGTIAGGAETFFGKSKASTMDKKLSKLTTIVAVVFVVLVLVSYLLQDTTGSSKVVNSSNTGAVSGETVVDTNEGAATETDEGAAADEGTEDNAAE